GQFAVESVVSFPWNRWSVSAGIRGQFGPEYAQEFEVVCESESNDAIKELVKDGYGISLLPEFMVRKEITEGIFSEILLREAKLMMSFFLIYRKQDNLSKLQQDLIAYISAYPKMESPQSQRT
ncbi:DNA-binding transcriptional LysR family regulator, partial [Desulfomicrobium macestii]